MWCSNQLSIVFLVRKAPAHRPGFFRPVAGRARRDAFSSAGFFGVASTRRAASRARRSIFSSVKSGAPVPGFLVSMARLRRQSHGQHTPRAARTAGAVQVCPP